MNYTNIALVLISVFLNAIAQLFIKSGTNALGSLRLGNDGIFSTVLRVGLEPHIIGGLVCCVFSVAIWIVALSKIPVSIAYPMLSIGYVVNIFAAWILFGEVISIQKIIGVSIIIVGVFFVARS